MNTRTRIIISSIVVPVVFVFLTLIPAPSQAFEENRNTIIPGVVALVQMLLVAWVVNFRLRGERLFTVLLFPAISQAIIITFLDVVLGTSSSQVDRFSTLFFSMFLLFIITYILTSNINILNLAVLQNIPLGQAGRAAHYVLTLVFSYFFFILLVSWDVSFLLKAVIVFAFIFTYTFVALWTISLAYSQRFISSLSIALLSLFAFIVLGIWPLESFYFALFMVLIYYMSLGVALEVREIVSRLIWYEYTALFLVMLFLLLTTASWGVNGTIL